MERKQTIQLVDIIREKDKFIAFSNLTKQDIKKIYFLTGDEDIQDLDAMEYDWRLPLYAKIIFRFVQNDCQVCGMYWGLDPNCQRQLRYHFRIYDDRLSWNGQSYELTESTSSELVNFFCWIRNSFGLCELLEVEGTLNQVNLNHGWESAKLYHSWKKNVVTYFYELSEDQQKKVVEKYNTMIEKFNDLGSDDPSC